MFVYAAFSRGYFRSSGTTFHRAFLINKIAILSVVITFKDRGLLAQDSNVFWLSITLVSHPSKYWMRPKSLNIGLDAFYCLSFDHTHANYQNKSVGCSDYRFC